MSEVSQKPQVPSTWGFTEGRGTNEDENRTGSTVQQAITYSYTIIVIKFLGSVADPYPDQNFIRIQAKTISTFPDSDKKGFSNKKIIFYIKNANLPRFMHSVCLLRMHRTLILPDSGRPDIRLF